MRLFETGVTGWSSSKQYTYVDATTAGNDCTLLLITDESFVSQVNESKGSGHCIGWQVLSVFIPVLVLLRVVPGMVQESENYCWYSFGCIISG